MQLLHRPSTFWEQISGLNTAREIVQQPAVWRELADSLDARQERIDAFLGDWLRNPVNRVILTGAGSSAYCGSIVADELNAVWAAEIRAIPTTSLLTHPQLYLDRERPTLLVSFARSGNSPESQAAVNLVRDAVSVTRFINLTCNEQGELAQSGAALSDTLNVLMPAVSCDKGFAMTSSFSSMLLSALTIFGKGSMTTKQKQIHLLAAEASALLKEWAPRLIELTQHPCQCVVYLGSGPLEALAREAALKMLELTAGRVLAMSDSSMGFRHGPKSALNAQTLLLAFQSNDPHAQRYDQLLLDEVRRDAVAGHILAVGPADLMSKAGPQGVALQAFSDAWLAPLWLLVAQQLALHMSAALGLTPDNPFPDGTVNRVVEGVSIFPYENR